MSMLTAREREIREIAIAANSGEASDEQIARLDELVRSDRQFANYAARLLDQQASRAWHGLGTGSHPGVAGQEARSDDFDPSPPSPRSLPPAFAWAWPTIAVGI